MAPITRIQGAFVLFIIGSIMLAQGQPLEGPASAASPAVSPAVVESPTAPVVAAPPAPATNPSQDPTGSGTITEHKQADGSILTITRFNGPISSNAFQPNPYGFNYQSLYESQMQNMALIYRNNLNLLNYMTYAASNPANTLTYYNSFAPQIVPSVPAWYSPSYPQGFSSVSPAGIPWGISPYGGNPYYFPWGQPGPANVSPVRQ